VHLQIRYNLLADTVEHSWTCEAATPGESAELDDWTHIESGSAAFAA